MDKKKAMKWVKALRSGKFTQTKEKLRKLDDNQNVVGHCCLGVLGEISKCNINDLTANECLSGTLAEECGINDEVGAPTDEDGDRIKIRLRVGNTYKEFNDLAEANDDGASFASIATWIEKNYENL